MPIGSYVVAVEARYADSFAISSDTFKVIEIKELIPPAGRIFTVLLAFVATLVIIYFFIKEKEKLKQKRSRRRDKKSK